MGINQRTATNGESRCRPSAPPVSASGGLRRHLMALAVVAGVLLGMVSTASVASAAETNRFHRSSSPEIAEAAVHAIAAQQMWQQSGRVTVYLEYLEQLGRVAHLTAEELALDGDEMQRAWIDTEPAKQRALLSALTQLGVPYRSMASNPGEGFDCSGLVMFAWAQAGVALPRSSGDQIRSGAPLSRDEAQAGDFAYYPGHMMMYLGVDDAVVHSPNSGNLVEIRFVSRSLQYGDPLGA
jgi:cell wall-associated NlpC family hydrolase